MLLSQAVIVGGLVAMALSDPQAGLRALTLAALVVAFASATQDIALDAYRIESAGVEKQGALAAMYQTGYRLAMIWAGAGVLWIAARASGSDSGYHAERLDHGVPGDGGDDGASASLPCCCRRSLRRTPRAG